MQGEIKPGYVQTEVGVIPEDWGFFKLHRFVVEHRSGIYKKSATYGDGCNIVGVADIYGISAVDGRIFNRVPLSKDELKIFVLQPGDLLYGESSLVREGIARTVFVKNGGESTAFAWHTRRYRVRQEDLDSEYLFYFLQSDLARQHMMSNAIQTALTGINTTAYFSCPVLVPHLSEQRAIAAALADADALIAALEGMIAKKRDLKQAAMQHLLTGKTRLPGFSGEWEVKRLGEIFEIGSSKRVFQSEWKTQGVPFYRAREIVLLADNEAIENQLFVSRDLYESHKANSGVPEVGDMLVTGVGTLGRVFVVESDQEFYFKDGNIIWFKIRGKMSASFLRQLFLTEEIMRQIKDSAGGSTVGTYTISGAKKTVIPFPSLSEQTAIAEVLSDMDADLDALEAQAAKARAVKQGMMQELLTGRVRLV